MTPIYDLSEEEWSELDVTAKERLVEKARLVLKRYQTERQERKQATVEDREEKARTTSAFHELLDERSIYDTRVTSVAEMLNVQYEELWPVAFVSVGQLAHLIAQRYAIPLEQAAQSLRDTLPLRETPSKKASKASKTEWGFNIGSVWK